MTGCPGTSCSVVMSEAKSITAVFELQVVSESEPNGNKASSDPMNFDEIFKGYLQTDTDEDWFSIDNSSGSDKTVTVRFNNESFETTKYWVVQIYNSSDEMIGQVEVGDSDTFNISLPTGDSYYFAVVNNSDLPGSSTLEYQLTLLSNIGKTLSAAETEFNGDSVNANRIAFGDPVSGQLMEFTDTDWFEIDNDTSGRTATVVLSAIDIDKDWVVAVYSADASTLLARVEVGDSSEFNIALPDVASYYFVVSNSKVKDANNYYNSGQYTLLVRSNDVEIPVAEREDNDILNDATAVDCISLPASMTGQSMNDTPQSNDPPVDDDWFKLENVSAGTVSIKLTTQASGTRWGLTLYEADGTTKNGVYWYGFDKKEVTRELITGGTYYLKINIVTQYSGYSSEQYTITMETTP